MDDVGTHVIVQRISVYVKRFAVIRGKQEDSHKTHRISWF